jgi:hypothetical protein
VFTIVRSQQGTSARTWVLGDKVELRLTRSTLERAQPRTASIAFTDGDTLRRVTITDADVVATSRIIHNIRRPDSADDSADAGYLYIANVVEVQSGSFDVLIAALDWGFGDPVENPPNETVQFQYVSY